MISVESGVILITPGVYPSQGGVTQPKRRNPEYSEKFEFFLSLLQRSPTRKGLLDGNLYCFALESLCWPDSGQLDIQRHLEEGCKENTS